MSDWRTPRKHNVVKTLGSVGKLEMTKNNDSEMIIHHQSLMDTQIGTPENQKSYVQSNEKLKVATIGPTPQIEVGELSPVPQTPRIPLNELDHSNLSQRLFHSPSSISNVQTTSPFPSQISPSELLMTQSQPSISSTFTSNRRHQLNTERQLIELQQQVEQLGSLLTRQRTQSSSFGVGNSGYKQQVDKLSKEREELILQLDSKNQQLDTFKSALVQLNTEYSNELAALKEEAKVLTNQVENKSQEYRKLITKQEDTLAMYSALENQHTKSLKTIHGLQSYIEGLPAKEEMDELKCKHEAAIDNIRGSDVKSTELERQLTELRTSLRLSEQSNKELEIENKELRERNKELAEKVAEAERIRLEARGLGNEDLELLIFDKKELTGENEKLKITLELRTKRYNEDSNRMEGQVTHVSRLLEASTEELQTKAIDLRLAQGRCQNLEQKLLEKKTEVSTLTSRLQLSTTQATNLQTAATSETNLHGRYTRLARCMGKCIIELRGLNELCDQVMGGGDPNVSLLLGVKEFDNLGENTILDRDTSTMSIEEKLELVSNQLREVQRVQEQIRDLRTRIADKYAEKLADNMTSCVTQ